MTIRVFNTDEIKTHLPVRDFVLLRSHKRAISALEDKLTKRDQVMEAAKPFLDQSNMLLAVNRMVHMERLRQALQRLEDGE